MSVRVSESIFADTGTGHRSALEHESVLTKPSYFIASRTLGFFHMVNFHFRAAGTDGLQFSQETLESHDVNTETIL